MAKRYIDIGHQSDKARLWIFYEDRLIFHPVAGGHTHESVWGMRALAYFRGRHDPESGEVSLIFPENWPSYYGVQDGLKEALENEFGDLRIQEFNPGQSTEQADEL